MCVCTHVGQCVLLYAFCGLTAIASDLINILVSREDIGAYSQRMGIREQEAQCVQAGSLSTTRVGPCLRHFPPFHHDHLHAWTKDEWITENTAWKLWLGFHLWWWQAWWLAQNWQETLMMVQEQQGSLSAIVCGQIHLLLLALDRVDESLLHGILDVINSVLANNQPTNNIVNGI